MTRHPANSGCPRRARAPYDLPPISVSNAGAITLTGLLRKCFAGLQSCLSSQALCSAPAVTPTPSPYPGGSCPDLEADAAGIPATLSVTTQHSGSPRYLERIWVGAIRIAVLVRDPRCKQALKPAHFQSSRLMNINNSYGDRRRFVECKNRYG